MKKFGFRHLMYGWLAVVALVLTAQLGAIPAAHDKPGGQKR